MRYPNQKFRKLVEFINEEREDKSKKIYVDREPREIDWVAYNLSQIENIRETILFVNKEVDKCKNPPKKVGEPLTNPKILCKAILICEAFGLTERNAERFIEFFGTSIKIRKLDDRVIGNAYSRPEIAYILKQIFERNKDSDRVLTFG